MPLSMTLEHASSAFCESLSAQLPPDSLRPTNSRYLEDPRGRFLGKGTFVALPRSVEDVSTILRNCNNARVGVVPFGGGTGLVCGQVSPNAPAPLILSMERMNAIRSIHPLENVIIAEAGAILADLQSAARNHDRLFPLSLGSEGSARIGGNLSTNAGGVNVLRYGNARDLCLSLEAVMPDGEIWYGIKRLRKDNTGYDIRNLLVGAEGTLGVITAAALKLFACPASVGTAIMVVENPEAALKLLELARNDVGEGISSFELIHGQGIDFVAEKIPKVRLPFKENPDWMVLIEFGLSVGADDALKALFSKGFEVGLVRDGLIAQNSAQRSDFWRLREAIPEANKKIGAVCSHDISLPLGAVPKFIDTAKLRITSVAPFRINCFGHLGDGNLHFNVFPPFGRERSDFDGIRAQISEIVHELVWDFEGSFSAEHGVGRLKVAELERYGDPTRLSAMRAIKNVLDPNGIMNPGAVLRI